MKKATTASLAQPAEDEVPSTATRSLVLRRQVSFSGRSPRFSSPHGVHATASSVSHHVLPATPPKTPPQTAQSSALWRSPTPGIWQTTSGHTFQISPDSLLPKFLPSPPNTTPESAFRDGTYTSGDIPPASSIARTQSNDEGSVGLLARELGLKDVDLPPTRLLQIDEHALSQRNGTAHPQATQTQVGELKAENARMRAFMSAHGLKDAYAEWTGEIEDAPDHQLQQTLARSISDDNVSSKTSAVSMLDIQDNRDETWESPLHTPSASPLQDDLPGDYSPESPLVYKASWEEASEVPSIDPPSAAVQALEDPSAISSSINDYCRRSAFTKALALITDLEQDEEYYSKKNPASWARIPALIGLKIQEKVHRLAQESLWHGSKQQFPDYQNEYWPDGPPEVCFGYNDLKKQQLTNGFYDIKNCDIDRGIAHSKMLEVGPLRNAVSHTHATIQPQQAKEIDSNLMRAHAIAVQFQQWDFSKRIQQQRARVRHKNTKAWEKTSAKFVNQTPNTYFEMHEQRLFYDVARYPERFEGCPPELVRAAEIWRRGGHPLSDGHTGKIKKGDGYIRRPGQEDEFFARRNRQAYAAGSEDFRKTAKSHGASNTLAGASRQELEEEIAKREKPCESYVPPVLDMSWSPAGNNVPSSFF